MNGETVNYSSENLFKLPLRAIAVLSGIIWMAFFFFVQTGMLKVNSIIYFFQRFPFSFCFSLRGQAFCLRLGNGSV